MKPTIIIALLLCSIGVRAQDSINIINLGPVVSEIIPFHVYSKGNGTSLYVSSDSVLHIIKPDRAGKDLLNMVSSIEKMHTNEHNKTRNDLIEAYKILLGLLGDDKKTKYQLNSLINGLRNEIKNSKL